MGEAKILDKLVVGILAHVDAGKTTLSEALLYQAGAVRTLGRVDHQDAFLDTFSMERQRGITIFSKQAQFTLRGREITLLDTPGHVDFSSEMERTLQVLDAATVCRGIHRRCGICCAGTVFRHFYLSIKWIWPGRTGMKCSASCAGVLARTAWILQLRTTRLWKP